MGERVSVAARVGGDVVMGSASGDEGSIAVARAGSTVKVA